MTTYKEKNQLAFLADGIKSLKLRFQNSLAAMSVTLSYLHQIEQTNSQVINKWWYERGTERI